MLIEALTRIEAAAKDVLAAVNSGAPSSAEARRALAVCKPAIAALSAAQTAASRVVAGVERHGDGGIQVLADSAGLTRGEAHSQIKTAEALQAAPRLRDAVEAGRVPQANAKRLAEAISKTAPEAVESDGELLGKAESMRPEQFRRVARRWTAQHQPDGGESDYRRLRARRCVRTWDGDDGMLHLKGEFDPVMGRQIANRINHHAKRMHTADQQNLPKDRRRSLSQCLADALEDLTNTEGANTAGAGRPYADICVVAHVDDDTGALIGELPDGTRLPASVLDGLTCNATITGVVFDRRGKPIWQTIAGRDASESQRRLLRAKWDGCFHCGANIAICVPHHMEPVAQGGQTRVENLVPACWGCHNLIHRDGWQIHKSPDGNHTLHPPQRASYGPARAPEHPPILLSEAPPLFTAPAGPGAAVLFTAPAGPGAAVLFTAPAGPGAAERSVAPCESAAGPGTPALFAGPLPHPPRAETARAAPGPEPPPAGQPPSRQASPAAARAALDNPRAKKAARDGFG